MEFPMPAGIVGLTATCENFRSKFNHTLLIESKGFCRLKKASA